MSRTIRKNKLGEEHNDGKGRYKCNCEWCRGVEKKKNIKKALDLEIKNTVNRLYGKEHG